MYIQFVSKLLAGIQAGIQIQKLQQIDFLVKNLILILIISKNPNIKQLILYVNDILLMKKKKYFININ